MDSLTLFAVQREGRRVPWEVTRVNGNGRLDFPPETNLACILGIGFWCHIIENDIAMDENCLWPFSLCHRTALDLLYRLSVWDLNISVVYEKLWLLKVAGEY